jgi:hypothetical protein
MSDSNAARDRFDELAVAFEFRLEKRGCGMELNVASIDDRKPEPNCVMVAGGFASDLGE